MGGHWVNQNDSFFYRGDMRALNEFIDHYGMVTETPLAVVIHAGGTPRTGKLSDKVKTVPYNWCLTVNRRGWGEPKDPRRSDKSPGYVVTVHLWLGDGITLDGLKIADHTEVRSANEIEQFVAAHSARPKLGGVADKSPKPPLR